ncbi:MAG: hypothetical protein ACOH2N_16025 [Devosia sp.]
MNTTAEVPSASHRPIQHGLSQILAWLHGRDQAQRRRRETMNLALMSDYLRRDIGLQDYQITNRRP